MAAPGPGTAQIDAHLATLPDWRGDRVRAFRSLVGDVEPGLAEEWKWRTGIWSYQGKLVCGYGVFKEHVKFNFMRGASLADPAKLFNNGFDAKESRSIDLRSGDPVDAGALGDLVRRAVDLVR